MSQQRPTPVGDTLQRVLQRIDPDHRMHAFRVWTFWEEEVGEAIAAHAEPAGFRSGVLSVRVDSPAWMQELQFLKESLREQLNRRLGEPLIRDVYFVSGAVRGAAIPSKATAAPVRPRRPVPIPRLRNAELATVFTRIARAHAKRDRDS
jgi:predicted nucleic acid-binding Zn ribbon protein